MGEAPNRRMTLDQTTGTAPSTADVKAAIRETRRRLADHVARTADHVHPIFTTPDSVETESPVGGAVAGAIETIAVAGREARLGRCKEDRPSAPSSDRRDAGGYRRCARGLDRTSLTERIVEREGRHGKEGSETRQR